MLTRTAPICTQQQAGRRQCATHRAFTARQRHSAVGASLTLAAAYCSVAHSAQLGAQIATRSCLCRAGGGGGGRIVSCGQDSIAMPQHDDAGILLGE